MADRRGVRVLAGVVLLGVAALVAFVGLRQRSGGMAPDFVVPDLSGRAVRLSALRGRVVLVNLWTTWCPPCREEMPSMERLHQKMRGRDFQLLAVSQDEGPATAVETFVKEMKITFPVLVDPEHQVGDHFGVWGYPETFLIDREGRLVERIIGPRDWASPDSVAKIEDLLAVPTGAAVPSGG